MKMRFGAYYTSALRKPPRKSQRLSHLLICICILCVISLSFIPHAQVQSAKATGSNAWPMLGRDRARTNRSPANGPTTANIKWTYPATGALGWPVIDAAGVIYVTQYRDSTDPFAGDSLLAINPNGTLRWRKQGGFAERYWFFRTFWG